MHGEGHQSLPANFGYLVAGDYNVQSAGQAAYQELVGATATSDGMSGGRVFDPIASPGNWNNNAAFRYIRTQDPTGRAGGMDDRLDQFLLSGNLLDGAGLDYLGNPSQPFSLSTFADPNHSYRVWGNDGTSFNGAIATTNNQQVGPAIAQALIDSVGTSATGGHVPVFLDFTYSLAAVPEPGTGALVASGWLGVVVVVVRRRRWRCRQCR